MGEEEKREEGREKETKREENRGGGEPLLLTHQDVVWFDVSMEYATPLHELESQKKLLCVRTNGFDVETYVLTVLLEHFSEIHTVRGRGRDVP